MALPALCLPCSSSSFLYSFHSSKLLPCQLASGFSGQKLRIPKNSMKRSIQAPFFLIRVQLDKSNVSLSQDLIEGGEHILDDISDWISKKIAQRVRPHLPENFDVLDWIPSSLHNRIHSVERAATVFVRECLLLVLFSFVFSRVGRFCQWLNRVHYLRTHEGLEPSESDYQTSCYSAMEDPLKAGLVLWQLTHMLHVAGPLFKLKFGLLMVEKARSIGFIVVVSWFLFKWKGLVLQRFKSQSKADAPRFIALDKILSLLMYYLAGTCIGEVSGFALRSVLAIGGVSGIAVGFAAKELIGNFLGGVLLFATRPFVIGDRVKAESFEGWVEDIDFLHTKILGYDRSPVFVPNSAIMNEVIVNHSRAKCKQLVTVFVLRKEDVLLVDKITDEITEYLINHRKIDLHNGTKPVCYLRSISPEGLQLEIHCSVKEKGAVEYFKTNQEILIKVAQVVSSAGACFNTMPEL
eukprot:c14811_g1_i1 orf=133-1524(+)